MTEDEAIANPATILTHSVARDLLRHRTTGSLLLTAEDERSWSRTWSPNLRGVQSGTVLVRLWDSVLLRTFDAKSGSQPDEHRRMLARDARMRLDTTELRGNTLKTHANHRDWTPTPYISFTNSPSALKELADYRHGERRGHQEIVVVDPRIRFEIGLPVLHCKDEMGYYDVENPYRRDYFDGHFLCLWEVTPEEVVGIWDWKYLRSEPNWFENIVQPAVETHRENRRLRLASDNDSSQSENNDGGSVTSSERPDDSDVSGGDDAEGNEYWSESDDSDEKLVDENSTDELWKKFENFELN